jgi:hypothetical protein
MLLRPARQLILDVRRKRREAMKRFLLMLLTWVVGCSGDTDSSPRTADIRSKLLADLESLPVGLEVIHTPVRVGDPEGPNRDDWPYRWHFRTEVRTINRPPTITRFGIIAWDGSQWVLPPRPAAVQHGGPGEGDVRGVVSLPRRDHPPRTAGD